MSSNARHDDEGWSEPDLSEDRSHDLHWFLGTAIIDEDDGWRIRWAIVRHHRWTFAVCVGLFAVIVLALLLLG